LQSKNNKRLLKIKINRINKVEENKILLFENVNSILRKTENNTITKEDYTEFIEFLAKIMKQKINDKTIVFAFKMFFYCLDIIKINNNNNDKIYMLPHILLPFDSRIKKIFGEEFKLSSKPQVINKMK
jgi:N-glycosylase/DNA lyase